MTLDSLGVVCLLRGKKLILPLLFIPFIIFGQQLDVLSVFPLQNDNMVSANTEIRVDFNFQIDEILTR